jgi:SAM-dependent methyltransferase
VAKKWQTFSTLNYKISHVLKKISRFLFPKIRLGHESMIRHIGLAIEGGFLDYIALEPEGIVRAVGWSCSVEHLERLVVLKDPRGTSRTPDGSFRIVRPDLPDEFRLCGFMYEFRGGFSEADSMIMTIGDTQTVIEKSGHLSGPVPDYSRLLDCKEVLHRNEIYGSGPPVLTCSDEVIALAINLPSPILDFGCGAGALVRELRNRGVEAVGIEIQREELMLKVIPEVRAHLEFYDGTIPLPFDDGQFNSVTAIEVIEHIENFQGILGEIFRITRRSFLITVPDMSAIPLLWKHHVVPWHLLEATHVNFFTFASLMALLGQFWEPDRIKIFRIGNALVNGTFVPGSLAAMCSKVSQT